MRRAWLVLRRTGRAFYDDQMTHHAAALTYYGLMSLFPAALLGISLLGLLGQYPDTYNSVVSYLRDVVPQETLNAIDKSLRSAIRHKGNAATAFGIGVVTALYGTTGVLEATRRALNVAFRVESGRTFLHRKVRDILSSFILLGLVLITLVLVFLGGELADHLFGEDGAHVYNLMRWPAAIVIATVAFAYIYEVTPDLEDRNFARMLPGAIVAVVGWIVVSYAFSQYLSHYGDVSAIYGAFAGAIVLVIWVWLSNVTMLFGAEINAQVLHLETSGAGEIAVAGGHDDGTVPPEVAH
jgi:membrane protein